jgi:serine phosphatase RsbU (regulator of sigma subunit)
MDLNAKRFARKILLIHLLLLIVVLATVAGAGYEIYTKTREQLIEQAEDRQKLLAKQTASGIESHYQSILNDLDLMHREENEQTDAEIPAANRPTESPIEKATDRTLAGRSPIIGQIMWKQLEGRVSLLFALDHPGATPPPLSPNLLQPRRGLQGLAPIQDPAVLAMHLPPDVHLVGTADTRLNVPEIVNRCRDWCEKLKEPSIRAFEKFDGIGANVIGIPMPQRGRDLVAVVPITGIQKQFLQPLNDDSATGAWLIDEAGTAMAASRPELVGTSVTNIADPQLHQLAGIYILHHASGTQVMPRTFSIGSAVFAPAMITARPVTVGDKQWELFVTTSLDDVDGIVAKLLHWGLFWCIFVVLSVTAILVSTAMQMIRSRLRMERLQHEALTRELSQARQIQLAWLPEPHPAGHHVDIAAVNSPASHISGDFYNWFELPDGRMVVSVGDVTGHGMAAAFLMATTQLLVRNTMVRLSDPGRCLEEVNRQLCVQVFNGQFVTMVVAILDLANGKLQVATAGHPSPLIADGESFQPLTLEPQLVLGVDRDTKYLTEHFTLSPGASLLLYTDGVVECPDHRDARFGDERLRRTLYGRYDTAQEMLTRVVAAVDEFRGGRTLDDDLTLVAVQLQPIHASRPDVAAITI